LPACRYPGRKGCASIHRIYTISKIAEVFGLSRSTLLYYDRIGLLSPSERTASGYRLYSEKDRRTLEQIVLYREIGVPLDKIRDYLNEAHEGVLPMLANRLLAMNAEIDTLREQQRLLLEMIEAEGSLKGKKPFLEKMTHLAEKAGIRPGDEAGIHRVFERVSPEAHRRFLEFLGFSETEVREFIRHIKKRV
jgi:DNA-binding transcriptional MerR regulator